MAWYAFLDPVFGPLLKLGPFWAIFIMAFGISLIITLVYKWVTDQNMMKKLKEEQKEYQKKIKTLKENPSEMMKVQKQAMKKNMEYMKHSFKPTLITMLPIILIFGWMSANLAFEPIFPNETYSITAYFEQGVTGEVTLVPDKGTTLLSSATQKTKDSVVWRLKSPIAGTHLLQLKHSNQTYNKEVLITRNLKIVDQFVTFEKSDLKSIAINYKKLKPLGQSFNIFDWYPGWLAIYIILSIVFSMGLRKALKIY